MGVGKPFRYAGCDENSCHQMRCMGFKHTTVAFGRRTQVVQLRELPQTPLLVGRGLAAHPQGTIHPPQTSGLQASALGALLSETFFSANFDSSNTDNKYCDIESLLITKY